MGRVSGQTITEGTDEGNIFFNTLYAQLVTNSTRQHFSSGNGLEAMAC